ncbi:MAG: hypothetical protein IJ629_04240 [Clostridia bacterium]|nr:hypothetical protein [Clostridia bacterium]
MAVKRSKKNPYLMPAIIAIALIVVLIAIITLTGKRKNGASLTETEIAKIDAKNQEQQNIEIKQDLSKKSEQERMQYYCGNFFNIINSKNYEKAYSLLYSEYKENYFPTLANFERYLKENFPSNVALSYTNIERLGDIYVLSVSVKDTVNGNYGHNFDMYVVLQEKDLNDYVISFSRNSAVREEE